MPAPIPQTQIVRLVQHAGAISMPALYAVTIKTLCAVRVIHVKVANTSGRHAPPCQTHYAMIVVNVRPVRLPYPALSVQGLKTPNVKYVKQENTKTVTVPTHVMTVRLDIRHLKVPPSRLTVWSMHNLKVLMHVRFLVAVVSVKQDTMVTYRSAHHALPESINRPLALMCV